MDCACGASRVWGHVPRRVRGRLVGPALAQPEPSLREPAARFGPLPEPLVAKAAAHRLFEAHGPFTDPARAATEARAPRRPPAGSGIVRRPRVRERRTPLENRWAPGSPARRSRRAHHRVRLHRARKPRLGHDPLRRRRSRSGPASRDHAPSPRRPALAVPRCGRLASAPNGDEPLHPTRPSSRIARWMDRPTMSYGTTSIGPRATGAASGSEPPPGLSSAISRSAKLRRASGSSERMAASSGLDGILSTSDQSPNSLMGLRITRSQRPLRSSQRSLIDAFQRGPGGTPLRLTRAVPFRPR